MTIKKVFRVIYAASFIFILVMIGILLAIYFNQKQIEENALLTALQDRDIRQASSYIRIMAALVILLTVLLILLYRIVNKRIAEPLRELLGQTRMVQHDQNRLTEQIIEISMGNLTADFAPETKPLTLKHADEFNELAKGQNEMIISLGETAAAIGSIILGIKTARDKLNDVNIWLEKTVEERTRDLKDANAELELAHRQLTSLDKAKSAFLSMASHEIRTPLNGIQGFTYLMRDMPQAPEVAEVFSILEVSVNRLERFSRVALLITELQARDKDIHKDRISPADLIMPVIRAMDEKIKQKNLQITTDGDMVTTEIKGDLRMLPMCMESIIDNAITYSSPGGVIRTTAGTDNDTVSLLIKDQGRGFSETALKNLFTTFSPGEEHIDENVGLDLALAKMIMDAHGGKIKVGNNPGGGAWVELDFTI